jgi:Tol biopolymer transport system component
MSEPPTCHAVELESPAGLREVSALQGGHLLGVQEAEQVALVRIDGTERRVIGCESRLNVPLAWTPDGSEVIACVAGGHDQVVLVAHDVARGTTRALRTLPRDDGPIWFLECSPSGDEIAYMRRQSDEIAAGSSVVVIGRDGTVRRTLDLPGIFRVQPAAGPGWRALLTKLGRHGQPQQLVDLGDGHVVAEVPVATHPLYGEPCVSADGSNVAAASPSGVEVLELATGSVRRLTDFGEAPVFDPSGTRLAMHHGLDSLWTVQSDGAKPTQLLAIVKDPEYPPIPRSFRGRPTWSADGRLVAARLYRWHRQAELPPLATQLATMNAASAPPEQRQEAMARWLEFYRYQAEFAEVVVDLERGEYLHQDGYRAHVAFAPT